MFGKITEIIDNYVYVENSTHELKNNILIYCNYFFSFLAPFINVLYRF